jgi:hypothetical protein
MNKSMFVNTFYRPVFLLQMPIRYISLFLISFPTEFAYLFCGGISPDPDPKPGHPDRKVQKCPRSPWSSSKQA